LFCGERNSQKAPDVQVCLKNSKQTIPGAGNYALYVPQETNLMQSERYLLTDAKKLYINADVKASKYCIRQTAGLPRSSKYGQLKKIHLFAIAQ